MLPVSVCHQVSTIGHFPLPTSWKYHSQASGFIGSPTVPRTSNESLEEDFNGSMPCAIRALIAVGAV